MGHSEQAKKQKKKKQKKLCQENKKKREIFWYSQRRDAKLVNRSVKDTRNGGEENVKPEQTKQIYARCSGTVMVKSAHCGVVVSHCIHRLECRALKAPWSQTHTAWE